MGSPTPCNKTHNAACLALAVALFFLRMLAVQFDAAAHLLHLLIESIQALAKRFSRVMG